MKYPQLVSMPSAVSDWLEEQLEARGIDAVVYTRYVLSLLYKDPEDIICPDQDLHFTSSNKGLKSSGGGKKKFYRSLNYWGQSDIDRLKRSAAVECLKSASDQKCGIEMLVDELCKKLKEIKNDPDLNEDLMTEPSSEINKSTQDPVKRYYAAFPPLSKNTASNNIITLIPKWFGSPKKKLARNKTRSLSWEEKLHYKVESDNMKARSTGKQRGNFFSRKNSWSKNDMSIMSDLDCIPKSSNNRILTERKKSLDIIACSSNEETSFFDEKDESMYDDLPVDIIDLLDSPSPQEVNVVEMMNMANMRETGNKKFIQCGTNITSSIWSNDTPINDNIYNAKLTGELNLDLQFQSINIDENFWSSDINTLKDNVANSLYENYSKNSIDEPDFSPWGKLDQWSEVDNYESEVQDMNVVSKSLLQLNHSENSCFTVVKPRPLKISTSSFESTFESNKKTELKNDEVDLLSSAISHFRPINEKQESNLNGKYADGTTFAIPNSLEKVHFHRSKSGTMYLKGESGLSKKYFEYKKVSDELTLKFIINKNHKAAQTEPYLEKVEHKCMEVENEFYFPGDHDLLEFEENLMDYKIDKTAMITEDSYNNDYTDNTQSDCVVAEIFGKMELKCDNCNKLGSNNWECQGKNEKRNIWSGGEICMTCLRDGRKATPSHDHSQLREDITQDGEQLLSDLSSLQKCYMEDLPIAELSCDINKLIGAKEWSEAFFQDSVPLHSGSFSFATRLQQDCLVNMTAIPTLRSITL